MEPSPNQNEPQPKNIIENEIINNENDYANKYREDIFLISEFLHKKTEIYTFLEQDKGTMNKYCDKDKYFKKKGTKLSISNEQYYPDIIRILSGYVKIDDYIFLLFDKLDIYLIKLLINGYINHEEYKASILPILQKLLPLMFNNEYISYIYKKLSKIFRLHLKDNASKEDIQKTFKRFFYIFHTFIIF